MFHFLGFILFGLIIGLLARLLMPGKDQMSIPVTALLGIAGALLAGFIGRVAHWYGPGDRAGFITSTLGALLLLFGYNRFVLSRHGHVGGGGDHFSGRPV
jgi:uncharacterized membrane protein YeaQ/YmgE (transglycosylase-associated protein family)